ncbi:hypothetical protein Peur_015257 [Populus x canadensis]
MSTPSPSLQLMASNSSPPTTQKAPILRPTANNSSPLHCGQQQQPLSVYSTVIPAHPGCQMTPQSPITSSQGIWQKRYLSALQRKDPFALLLLSQTSVRFIFSYGSSPKAVSRSQAHPLISRMPNLVPRTCLLLLFGL